MFFNNLAQLLQDFFFTKIRSAALAPVAAATTAGAASIEKSFRNVGIRREGVQWCRFRGQKGKSRMKQSIVRLIPSKLRPPMRRLYQCLEYDIGQRIGPMRILYQHLEYDIGMRMGRRDALNPPKWLHPIGSSGFKNFKEVGEEFFQYFVNIGGLQPYQRVLDVGSGTGRMALPLIKYLKDGSYEGIDIVAPSIEWCQNTYTPRYPNFHFHFSDIYNKMYNPTGKYKASEYSFPFGTSSFDFVFLTSVFTHMLPQDLDNYLSEVVRVLKRDGRCLITYFLLNPESLELIEAKLSSFTFRYDLTGCRVENADVPEAVVAYDDSTIRSLYQKYDLKVLEPIYFGKWCGRKKGLSFQDMIVATKPH